MLEHRKASKLAARIVEAIDDYCISHDLPTSAECKKSRKRGAGDEDNNGGPEAKMAKGDPNAGSGGGGSDAPTAPMTADDIRRMMANTMAQIKKRKAELGALQSKEEQTPVVGPVKPSAGSEANLPPQDAPTKLPSIADLQASIKSRMEKVAAVLPPAAPTGLRINEEVRKLIGICENNMRSMMYSYSSPSGSDRGRLWPGNSSQHLHTDAVREPQGQEEG